MPRRLFVAGNWKQNLLLGEAADLTNELIPMLQNLKGADVAVCPGFMAIASVGEKLAKTNIMLGAQNAYAEEKDGKIIQSGAFTGEVSPAMLKDAGCEWVILGHSERRQFFCETDERINRKIKACFEVDLKPIVCVGETLEEREGGSTADIIDVQVRTCLSGLPADRVRESVVAYEPVWAIGTGKTATPAMAQEVHAQIRDLLRELFGDAVADAVRIQYGGSVKPGNAKELFAQPDIDGGLIGGAALKASDFSAIVQAAAEA